MSHNMFVAVVNGEEFLAERIALEKVGEMEYLVLNMWQESEPGCFIKKKSQAWIPFSEVKLKPKKLALGMVIAN